MERGIERYIFIMRYSEESGWQSIDFYFHADPSVVETPSG
jgi:hypothetical protein